MLYKTVPISINTSTERFSEENTLSLIESVICKAGIHPTDLELEMTEKVFAQDTDAVKNTIISLKEMGIKICLDDFGTGYSSLSYLTKFPFDIIKIDQSFIRNITHSNQDLIIIKMIIKLAKELQTQIVAEGVETIEQLTFLKQEECNQIQGYLYCPPVSAKKFEIFLKPRGKSVTLDSNFEHYHVHFPFPLEATFQILSIEN